jgi:transcription antitermination factor NusA-like protein
MKLPICVFDAKSGLLCQDCQAKLERGEITPIEVEISEAVVKIEEQFPTLKDITIGGAVDVGPFVILKVEEKDIMNIIGPKGKIIGKIESMVKKNIRVVEDTKDVQRVIESLLSGIEIIGINKIFVPDGSEELKIRIRSIDRNKIPASGEELREIIFKITGELTRLSFE